MAEKPYDTSQENTLNPTEFKEINQTLWTSRDILDSEMSEREKLQKETLRQSCCPVMA